MENNGFLIKLFKDKCGRRKADFSYYKLYIIYYMCQLNPFTPPKKNNSTSDVC